MNYRLIFLLITLLTVIACKQDYSTTKTEGKRIAITDTLATNPKIEAFIKPYRESVERDLDSVLAYAVDTYSKTDGNLNTAIGNFMADAVYDMSNPVFKKRTGKSIDMVLLNHGGIRSIISKGNITSRTAYQVMPFDNAVVVTAIKGEQINDMLNYLSRAKRAHPVSKLKVVLNDDYSLNKATINGGEIEPNKTYFVATNDYLYNGGDRMSFLKSKDTVYSLDYKIRNLLIDYFKKTDTIQPTIDDRFIQLKDN